MKMILSLAALAATPAAAEPFQNIPALEARLIGALGAGIGETGGPMAQIDRRLKLAPCPTTVQIDPPVMGAIALRCPAANWRIRVPLTRLGGAATPATAGGAMLVPVKQEMVIRRGDPIDLVAESDGFSVSVAGIAQEDGAAGNRIRVKADGKNAPIFAEVIEAGRARLAGFK
ncbi:flagella basal body P-ring formation protein FlgA [Sphingomonas nostoxanthinifaciens]|uniref:flagella basal body P-ring formation protein FlgA n=1 Tax=Sphingomonas nostoxanthinifaciens TaxID=2872652 RepID=UPI001CC1F99A|nr:flagella basal body P-ring formation protein FlgA [Sphingomonas nostoxanthinifaciens]UAK26052.1 flagella basal body P-ring formation protein FlgA [Sphingomonas nostoxanthinifaciens]